jgi:glutathione peroxidase-family protein
MKLLFLYLFMILLNASSTSSFYEIKFESIDGTLIKTSAYQGKKVVVAVVSANTAGVSLVKYLDSVQKANSSVQVIAIPTADFDGSVTIQDLKDLKKNISIVVAKPQKVKKSNASLQHPLFVWLTQSKENQHFDKDVEGEGQLFVVSAKGTLYSVLPKDAPKTIIAKAINQPFSE